MGLSISSTKSNPSSNVITTGSSCHIPRRRRHAPVTFTNLPHTDDVLVVMVWVIVRNSVTVRVAAGPNCRFWGRLGLTPKILEPNFEPFCALAKDSTTENARTTTATWTMKFMIQSPYAEMISPMATIHRSLYYPNECRDGRTPADEWSRPPDSGKVLYSFHDLLAIRYIKSFGCTSRGVRSAWKSYARHSIALPIGGARTHEKTTTYNH